MCTHTYTYLCTTFIHTCTYYTWIKKKKNRKHSHICSLRHIHLSNLIHGQHHLRSSLRTRTLSQSCRRGQVVVGFGFNPESYKNSTMINRSRLGTGHQRRASKNQIFRTKDKIPPTLFVPSPKYAPYGNQPGPSFLLCWQNKHKVHIHSTNSYWTNPVNFKEMEFPLNYQVCLC